MPGMIEHGRPFRTLADALALRNHLIRVLEEADLETDEAERRKLLTFVVAGGGFSGVELMAELNDFVHGVKGNYPRLRDAPVRCVPGTSQRTHPAGDGPNASRCSPRGS